MQIEAAVLVCSESITSRGAEGGREAGMEREGRGREVESVKLLACVVGDVG